MGVDRRAHGEVVIWDAGGPLWLTAETFMTCLLAGADSQTHICFRVDGAEQDLLSEAEAQQLLDMAAAGSEPEAFVVLSDGSDMDPEAQDSDPGPLDWIDENGRVAVEQKLLEDLGAEVARHIKSAEKQRLKPDPQGWHRCPACPFRGFRGSARVASHLRTYHTEKKQFVCSGTKQMRIVLSLSMTRTRCRESDGVTTCAEAPKSCGERCSRPYLAARMPLTGASAFYSAQTAPCSSMSALSSRAEKLADSGSCGTRMTSQKRSSKKCS